MLNFKDGSIKSIREAIAKKTLTEDTIKVWSRGSDEYKRLEAAVELLRTYKNCDCHIGETYFDAGQDWKWTTIIVDRSSGSYQLLCPRDHELICRADSAEELGKVVDSLDVL